MEKELSRRNFLKGSAVVGAALGVSALAGCGLNSAAGEKEQLAWDKETEVLVCGCGAAGSACALNAADGGAQVLVIEKGKLPGGSMCRSGGGMAGAGTSMQKAAGIKDNADDFYNWIMLTTNGLCSKDIARVYADNSAANLDWMNDLSLKFNNNKPLFLGKLTEDTKRVGINRRGVGYAAFGLTADQVTPRSHWAVLKDGSTATNAGPELYYPLYLAIKANKNITVEYETALKKLIVSSSGEIIGIVATQGGKEIKIKAKKGVVLTTGGFPNNADMRKEFCYDTSKCKTYMDPNCTGDGVQAGMAVGAKLSNMCQSYPLGDGVSYTATYNEEWKDMFPMWLKSANDPNKLVAPAPIIAETHGGVVINTSSQVLNVWGEVIPRLYAAGCDVGSNIFGKPGNYPGCGSYVGFAICFGRIAGDKLAAEINREV